MQDAVRTPLSTVVTSMNTSVFTGSQAVCCTYTIQVCVNLLRQKAMLSEHAQILCSAEEAFMECLHVKHV